MFPNIPLTPEGEALKREILEIPWTAKPMLDDLPAGLSPDEIDILHDLAVKGDKRAVPQIKKYIDRFPTYPTLMNYLRVAYEQSGRRRQANKVLKQLAKQHPNYLFTRVSLAIEALDTGKTDEAVEALGADLDIRKLYPDRPRFHESEMRNFYMLAACVHARLGRTELALGVKEALEKISRDPDITETIMGEVMIANLADMRERIQEDAKKRISVEIPAFSKKLVSGKRPSFHHEDIISLYEYEMDLPVEAIRSILGCPRETLVRDLCLVLKDCATRTPNFMKHKVAETGESAAVHALHFLAEINATEALEDLLEFLSIHPEALDYWLYEGLDYHPRIARIVSADIPRCVEWLKAPAIPFRGKGLLVEAMEYFARTDSRHTDEVVAGMEQALKHQLNSSPEDNILDSRVTSQLVTGLIELRARHLEPLIEAAYAKGCIEEFFVGSLESTKNDILKPLEPSPDEMPSLEEQYDNYQQEDDPPPLSPDPFESFSSDTDPEFDGFDPPGDPYSGLGRNDPCPCGSGRKFKKCCMKN